MTAPSWQKIFSTLAGERSRELYARAVLGQPLDATPKEVQRLTDAGLLTADGEVDGRLFTAVLAAAAPGTPKGVDRFFRDGRIDGLPRAGQDRADLLAHLADRLLPAGEEISEPEVNRLLGTVTRDVPTLRRALVDSGLVERYPDGTGYRRVIEAS
ncbi:DUF2087 domain-containing protein [Arthrobacter agilis]|uniref:DUF2087 domain-containing protein n=1 Tax=Arthrobacter agilis TaxID=37921 RepID=UPI000B3544EE|nr:DUF2087 domain-containing protein [Arthrobacter agilis]OUM40446.1 hypothetical protein B8W74_13060 [Arthrobacter agilis]PPB45061.1 DUF2087 domain-containing protein [Arthrobacter agilis]TPV27765.1 DUF2087 domain-containing protein [Arthrobacter agilis]VDR31588.1 Uncharacterized protein conserved in bacteria (DUF2087) [Arthrobacter agilis]